MANNSNKANINGKSNSGSSNTTTTQLPGVNNAQVISSSPKLIKENSQFATREKK